jgi:hypothetical protein
MGWHDVCRSEDMTINNKPNQLPLQRGIHFQPPNFHRATEQAMTLGAALDQQILAILLQQP